MRKVSLVLGLVACLSVIESAHARMIGTNPVGAQADAFCVGGRLAGNVATSLSEVCVDSGGNFVPTTTSTNSLGTSGLKWLNVNVSSAVNAQQFVPTDTSLSRNHTVTLTSTTLLGVTPSAVGDLYTWVNQAGGFQGACISTGLGQFAIVLSSSANTSVLAPCRQ